MPATIFLQSSGFLDVLYIIAFALFIQGLRGLSGPTTAACAAPSSCQKTKPHVSLATAVIAVTCSLRHVHTVEIHDDSDGRVSNSKPMATS